MATVQLVHVCQRCNQMWSFEKYGSTGEYEFTLAALVDDDFFLCRYVMVFGGVEGKESKDVTEEEQDKVSSIVWLVVDWIEIGRASWTISCSRRAYLIQYRRRVNRLRLDFEAHDFQSQEPYSHPSLSTFRFKSISQSWDAQCQANRVPFLITGGGNLNEWIEGVFCRYSSDLQWNLI